MKIVDANVLLYAVNTDSDQHDASRQWLDASLAGADTVGFAWVPMLAFLRLTTHPSVFPRPWSVEAATEQISDWLSADSAVVVHPTARHHDVLRTVLGGTGTGGNLVNDAHLAALAIEHRASIVTYDVGFGRFDGVRWQRPSGLL